MLLIILGFSSLGSLLAITLAGSVLLLRESVRKMLIPGLISYATGTLLGTAFLGLIPNAIHSIPGKGAYVVILAGIVIFFILEKFIIWQHCPKENCEMHAAAGPLILIGDAFHNFADGVAIATSFLISVPLGIATSLAVITHEIPLEIGDFAILLESGYSRRKAFLMNVLSGLGTPAGALLAFIFLNFAEGLIPYILALSASSFIYISAANLIPRLHKAPNTRQDIFQIILISAGIATIILFQLRNH